MRSLIDDVKNCIETGEVSENSIQSLVNVTRQAIPKLQDGKICDLMKTPGRYLCYKDSEHGFVIMLMVWKSGDETPIHDHGTWGVEALLSGELRVTAFTDCEVDPKPAGSKTLKPGDVMFNLPPDRDVHCVCNVSDGLAVSMHIYGKEMTNNRQFVPGEGFQPCVLKTNCIETPQELGLDSLVS